MDWQHRAGVWVLQRAGKAPAAQGFTFQVRYKNGVKLKEGRFKLDERKKVFPRRVGRSWHRVPREAVAAPGSLEVSKARLDGVWSSLGQWKVSLPMVEVGMS